MTALTFLGITVTHLKLKDQKERLLEMKPNILDELKIFVKHNSIQVKHSIKEKSVAAWLESTDKDKYWALELEFQYKPYDEDEMFLLHNFIVAYSNCLEYSQRCSIYNHCRITNRE
ncbi:MAG: hypothetical protein JST83_06870 [Bacteroidetes bacterium]|nr:hypothetical protein [Bacteroidota bacterium]